HVGIPALRDAWLGYNTAIIAYGQTGSGKSYCMLGVDPAVGAALTEEAYSVPDARPDGGGLRGLIPRLCTGLFDLITHTTASSAGGTVQVEVSYLEVYNEEIRYLLAPQQGGPLKVRESPTVGVVVQGLTRHVVESYEEVAALLADGNRIRTLAATDRNAQSSRSHTVFTLHLTQHEVAKAAGGDS
ncbi:kif1, partial [Symbiodinium sp. KB8]